MRHSIIETAGIVNAARSIAPVVAVLGDSARRESVATIANELAESLVKDSRPVAIVDCDFTYPGLHERWGRELGPGLASVLAGDCLIDDVAEFVSVPNGRLLAVTAGEEAGIHVGRFVEMVAQAAVQRLTELSEVVVLNAGPLSSLVARDVAALSDTLVLVVGDDRSIDTEYRPAMLRGLRQYVSAWIEDPGDDWSPARFQPTLLPNPSTVSVVEEPIRWGRSDLRPQQTANAAALVGRDVFGLDRSQRVQPEPLAPSSVPTAPVVEQASAPPADRPASHSATARVARRTADPMPPVSPSGGGAFSAALNSAPEPVPKVSPTAPKPPSANAFSAALGMAQSSTLGVASPREATVNPTPPAASPTAPTRPSPQFPVSRLVEPSPRLTPAPQLPATPKPGLLDPPTPAPTGSGSQGDIDGNVNLRDVDLRDTGRTDTGLRHPWGTSEGPTPQDQSYGEEDLSGSESSRWHRRLLSKRGSSYID